MLWRRMRSTNRSSSSASPFGSSVFLGSFFGLAFGFLEKSFCSLRYCWIPYLYKLLHRIKYFEIEFSTDACLHLIPLKVRKSNAETPHPFLCCFSLKRNKTVTIKSQFFCKKKMVYLVFWSNHCQIRDMIKSNFAMMKKSVVLSIPMPRRNITYYRTWKSLVSVYKWYDLLVKWI